MWGNAAWNDLRCGLFIGCVSSFTVLKLDTICRDNKRIDVVTPKLWIICCKNLVVLYGFIICPNEDVEIGKSAKRVIVRQNTLNHFFNNVLRPVQTSSPEIARSYHTGPVRLLGIKNDSISKEVSNNLLINFFAADIFLDI